MEEPRHVAKALTIWKISFRRSQTHATEGKERAEADAVAECTSVRVCVAEQWGTLTGNVLKSAAANTFAGRVDIKQAAYGDGKR